MVWNQLGRSFCIDMMLVWWRQSHSLGVDVGYQPNDCISDCSPTIWDEVLVTGWSELILSMTDGKAQLSRAVSVSIQIVFWKTENALQPWQKKRAEDVVGLIYVSHLKTRKNYIWRIPCSHLLYATCFSSQNKVAVKVFLLLLKCFDIICFYLLPETEIDFTKCYSLQLWAVSDFTWKQGTWGQPAKILYVGRGYFPAHHDGRPEGQNDSGESVVIYDYNLSLS